MGDPRLREEVDEDRDNAESCSKSESLRTVSIVDARGEKDAPISTPMSAMTICSRRSACRLVTVSLSSCSMSCRTSTRALRRSMRCGISK